AGDSANNECMSATHRNPKATSPHRIRLRGPWEYAWRGEIDRGEPPAPPGDGPAGRAAMPARWVDLFGLRAGTARFRRLFHRPTNLDSDEALYLVVEGISGTATLALDGQLLGTISDHSASGTFDVTALVRPNSELTIDLTHNPRTGGDQPQGVWETVALEIR